MLFPYRSAIYPSLTNEKEKRGGKESVLFVVHFHLFKLKKKSNFIVKSYISENTILL